MSTPRRRVRKVNANDGASINYVTCSRCGQIKTEKSINRHFPQCTGSIVNKTADAPTYVDRCDDEEDTGFIFSDLDDTNPNVEHPFLRNHLSVESIDLLRNND